MRLGNKTKKISFRLTTEQYYQLYAIYEKYVDCVPNLTFSDFLRNLLLSMTANVGYENQIKS